MEECSWGCHCSCPHDGNITEGGIGTSTLGRTYGGLEKLQVVDDAHEVICTQKDEGRLLVLSSQEVVQEGSRVLDRSSCSQSGEDVSIFSCVRVLFRERILGGVRSRSHRCCCSLVFGLGVQAPPGGWEWISP